MTIFRKIALFTIAYTLVFATDASATAPRPKPPPKEDWAFVRELATPYERVSVTSNVLQAGFGALNCQSPPSARLKTTMSI
jgi:hypothetical protein